MNGHRAAESSAPPGRSRPSARTGSRSAWTASRTCGARRPRPRSSASRRSARPARARARNHFATALDLLTFGLNPILTRLSDGRRRMVDVASDDYNTYAVDGQTKILGMQPVTVPPGRSARSPSARRSLSAVPVRQRHRTCWFAPASASSSSCSRTATAASRPSRFSADLSRSAAQ